jgi:hypothetical protein
VTISGEHDNEPSVSIKAVEFLDQQSDFASEEAPCSKGLVAS